MEINNLKYFNNAQNILNDITLTFVKGESVFLSGTAKSGKTTLLKEILKKNNLFIKAFVSYEVIFDSDILKGKVKDCLKNCENKEIMNVFDINQILNENVDNLSTSQYMKIILIKALCKNPELLFVDRIFQYFNEKEKKKFINYIINDLKITLIYSSSDIEDALLFPYTIILNQGSVAIEGKTMAVLKEEKIMKRLGLGLPFIVDLSIQLKLYGLINDIYMDKRKLVNNIWK